MKMTLMTLLTALTYGLIADAGEMPADAAHLKALRDAKVAEIQRTYLMELAKLKEKHTKAGNLEGAKAIDEELGNTDASGKDAKSESADPISSLVGKWRRDYDSAIFEFKDSRSGTYAGTTPFTMTYDAAKKRVILESDKWVDSISFTLHPDILKGGHDNKIPYKLTRVK
jgi:hypothetical protein